VAYDIQLGCSWTPWNAKEITLPMELVPCPNSSRINRNRRNNWTSRICLACVLGCICRNLAFLERPIRVTQIDNQRSSGVAIARVRSSVRSFRHQHRDLYQSTYLYLSEDWDPISHQVVSDFRLPMRYYHVFSLVYYLSYRDPPKSPKIYTFHYPITF
jgi:hypothetical protein